MKIISVIIYAILSVGGLTLIKLGNSDPLALGMNQSGLSISVGWKTTLGLVCYVISFFVYVSLVAKNNLSYITPVSSAVVYILTMLVSLVIFKEHMTWLQWAGWSLILVGAFLMNLKK